MMQSYVLDYFNPYPGNGFFATFAGKWGIFIFTPLCEGILPRGIIPPPQAYLEFYST